MSSGRKPPAWRSRVSALAVSPDGREVLVLPTERGWRLPRVEVEGYAEDDLRNAIRSLEELLDEPVTILPYASYARDETEKVLDVVYVLERLSSAVPPSDGRWVAPEVLGDLPFAVPEQRDRAADRLRELADGIVPPKRVPWAREGWLVKATAWIDESLATRGRTRSGRVEQMRAWCLSTLLRVPTAEGTVFFKATAASPLFVDEGAVMEGLWRLFPDNVPAPIARDRERRWMLLDDLGPELGWDAPLEVREDVLRLFARMQIESAGCVDELLALGCVDRRLEWLAAEARELLEDDAAFAGLDEGEAATLRALGPKLEAMCLALAKTGVPEALVHGDLHLSNVARVDGHYVFFDWTDAAVTHPFLDVIDVVFERDEAVRGRLRDAYLSMWLDFAPIDGLLELWAVAEPLISLNQAVSYRHILANVEPGVGGELEWALPYFLREVLASSGSQETSTT